MIMILIMTTDFNSLFFNSILNRINNIDNEII